MLNNIASKIKINKPEAKLAAPFIGLEKRAAIVTNWVK